MKSRKLFLVWAGILLLSGMFLLGQDTWPPPVTCVDNDGDGYGSPADASCTYPELDCDETNADVYPGAPELCDGVDNQCPGDAGYGEEDEGCPRTTFVTEGMYTGAIGGVAAADAICQAEADAAGLLGVYKAWLCSSTSGPSTTFARSTAGYSLVNGTRVAYSWQDLTDGTIHFPITMGPTGFYEGAASVWTNCGQEGNPRNPYANPLLDSCADWQSGAGNHSGAHGDCSAEDIGWTARPTVGNECSWPSRLYCFEQSRGRTILVLLRENNLLDLLLSDRMAFLYNPLNMHIALVEALVPFDHS